MLPKTHRHEAPTGGAWACWLVFGVERLCGFVQKAKSGIRTVDVVVVVIVLILLIFFEGYMPVCHIALPFGIRRPSYAFVYFTAMNGFLGRILHFDP